MYFEIIGQLSNIERIARGSSVRERARLRKQFGAGRWRKLKGIATVRLANGMVGYEGWNYIGMRPTELERRS
jgi:hypothetical protein